MAPLQLNSPSETSQDCAGNGGRSPADIEAIWRTIMANYGRGSWSPPFQVPGGISGRSDINQACCNFLPDLFFLN